MATFLDLFGNDLDAELGSDDRVTLFTTARRKAAINKAQLEFVRATDCLTREFDIPLSDNDQELDLLVEITNSDFLWPAKAGFRIEKVDAAGTKTHIAGRDFPQRAEQWLDNYEPGWRTAPKGTPLTFYIREDGGQYLLGLYPPVKVATGEIVTLVAPYVAKPADLVADTNEPFTVLGSAKKHLAPWHPALVHFAASLLERLRKNYTVSDYQLTRFNGYIADYLQKQRPRGGNFVSYARSYRGESRGARLIDWRTGLPVR